MLISSRTNLVHNSSVNRLRQNRADLTRNTQSISSGSRIVSAGDDSGGFMVSTRMNQENVGLQQGIRNINDGISFLQTAEGALSNLESMINRLRELSIQASNSTYSTTDRQQMTTEYQSVTDGITQLFNSASFNRIGFFNSTDTSFDFQVGYRGGISQRISIDLTDLNANLTSLGISASAANGLDTVALAQAAVGETDTAMDNVITMRTYIGAVHQRLEIALNNATTYEHNLSSSESVIADTDYVHASAEQDACGFGLRERANGLTGWRG